MFINLTLRLQSSRHDREVAGEIRHAKNAAAEVRCLGKTYAIEARARSFENWTTQNTISKENVNNRIMLTVPIAKPTSL